ncbi:MAG: DNA mismatch repair endonuclease MutL [Candidatus Dormibacteria bacterium]
MADPARIRVLPPEVAEGIAAGEVIDRPAAVVKELVENALDAGATQVTVELEQGGLERIRVVDDGRGMSRDDLALALAPHATSKLRRLTDLSQLATYGFRGEALASIAAVAAVELTSLEADAASGLRVTAEPGAMGEVRPAAAVPGTVVEVRGLFRSAPARRAFMRSPRVEGQACMRVLVEAALARPEVGWHVRVDGRQALAAPGRGGLVEAARAVLGPAAAERLLPVDWDESGLVVRGVIGEPALARPNRSGLVLMVNGRRVHQRSLSAAVAGAYRGLLPAGRHPVAILDLICDPADVDVNVHPAKREVRFRDEGRCFEALQRSTWETIRRAQLSTPEGETAAGGPEPILREQLAPTWARAPSPERLEMERRPAPGGLVDLAGAGAWTYLGQAHARYLVVAAPFGLGILDQHAAHEKVLYHRRLEELLGAGRGGGPASQGLLEPLLLEVGAEAVLALEECGPDLERAGLALAPFGGGVLRCSAVPLGVRLEGLEGLLVELLQRPAVAAQAREERMHRLAASIACHSAVRFGDGLGPDQARGLLQDLAQTPGGITCPHGRPVLLKLEHQQLLAAFSRG